MSPEEKRYLESCRELVEGESVADNLALKKRRLTEELEGINEQLTTAIAYVNSLRQKNKRLKVAMKKKQLFGISSSLIRPVARKLNFDFGDKVDEQLLFEACIAAEKETKNS